MKKVKDLPLNERPREKLLERGARNLSDRELLAVILGKGTEKDDVLSLSKKIVKVLDQKGLDFEARDITHIDGIGPARAASIAAALEFVRRRIKPEGLRIKFPADILPLIQHYGDRKQEHLLCVSINGASEVINVHVASIGLIDRAHVHPREVFADALAERASALIIAHNHPVGSLEPSEEDLLVTRKLKEVAGMLGLNLLDHIIFNSRDYYSLVEHGEL